MGIQKSVSLAITYFINLWPDFTSKLVCDLAFVTPEFYIAAYDKKNHGLVNMSCNCDMQSGLSAILAKTAVVLHIDTSSLTLNLANKNCSR